jgi:hypothetical protein
VVATVNHNLPNFVFSNHVAGYNVGNHLKPRRGAYIATVMSDKPKRPKRPKPAVPNADRHRYKMIAIRPDDAIRAEIETLAQQDHRSVTSMTLVLVLEALAARRDRRR